ncbi:MAG: DUF4760 domain-containing protein, partial [Rubricella sp.]
MTAEVYNIIALSLSAFALLISVATFIWTTVVKYRADRNSRTLDLVFNTRLSEDFERLLAKRKRYFAEGETVPWEEFRAFLTATRNAELTDDEALRRRECAKAIRALLNYYEFIALGIRRRDLDEAMLRGSIRGIMV